MTAKEVFRVMHKRGCSRVRQKGSHVRMVCPCGAHFTTVPVHRGEGIGPGLSRAIEKDLQDCLGKGWLR